jgi:transcriptional regulator with XRE-family HTH domain
MKRRSLTQKDFERSRILGSELRAIRDSRGIRAKFVASKMNITPGYLCDLESGSRCLNEKLVRLYRKALEPIST